MSSQYNRPAENVTRTDNKDQTVTGKIKEGVQQAKDYVQEKAQNITGGKTDTSLPSSGVRNDMPIPPENVKQREDIRKEGNLEQNIRDKQLNRENL